MEKEISYTDEFGLPKKFIPIAITTLSIISSLVISKSLFIIVCTIIFCSALLYFSRNSHHKIFVRYLVLFIVLHLILFPIIYTFMLNSDPKSFEFNNKIVNNEKINSLGTLNEEININKEKEDVKLITNFLSKYSNYINQDINILDSCVFLVDNHVIFETCIVKDIGRNHPPFHSPAIGISNGNGLIIYRGGMGRADTTILICLKNRLKYHTNRISLFETRSNSIINYDDIWSFYVIFPYSLNLFFNENMVPISPLANIIYYLHQFIVFCFVISMITSFLPKFFKDKSQKNT